jgi:hypothetical protein
LHSSPPGAPAFFKTIFTEGRKGHEAASVCPHPTSKQALFLPLIAETPTTFGDLGVKTVFTGRQGIKRRSSEAVPTQQQVRGVAYSSEQDSRHRD